jgi:hypothetical protein
VGNLPRRGVEMIWIETRADRYTGSTLISSIIPTVTILTMRVCQVKNSFLKALKLDPCDCVENRRHQRLGYGRSLTAATGKDLDAVPCFNL